jgi:alpha-L-arabinofuranosidase
VVGTVELVGARAKPGGRAYLITGPSPEAQNTFENPRAVATQEVKFAAAGDRWEYRLPRHSVSWLKFELEG